MRLNSLHNGLYVAAKLLRAESIAIKLLPESHVDWLPADIAVGDTSQLQQFNWEHGSAVPTPMGCSHQRQSLFGVPGALSTYSKPDTHSIVAEIAINETVLDALPGQFLGHERRGNSKLQLGTVWFAITLHPDSPAHSQLFDPDGSTDLFELVIGVCSQALWGLYRSAMLQQDSVTQLPGAAEMRHQLQLNIANEQANSLLILLEIDNFSLLRRQLGSNSADALLRETAKLTRSAVRKNDGVFRYTDSIFAITADVVDDAAPQVIKKVSAAWKELACKDDYIGLTCSISFGLPNNAESVQHFLLSVEHALTVVKEQGGNQVLEADPAFALDHVNPSQATGGVFTSDPMKDYRNSRILWRATSLIATETSANGLSRAFANLLQDMLSLDDIDVLTQSDGELCSTLHDNRRPLTPAMNALVQHAIDRQSIQQSTPENLEPQALALPLLSRNQLIGALLIVTEESLDDSDTVFLKAIADQIAGALDRIDLAATQELLSARESASLRAEIRELKEHSHISKPIPVIAVSKAMQDVLAYIDKIAPTTASVLIMGESGAGKEVMAKAIVAASNRSDAPFITVDCSAITHSLIDSELFGRVKGAFTGADDASPGRIAEAHGGTLFLDEIGELPMDVQAKLLRFVQEKELIAVGDTRRRHIDTRIVCATNRDLLLESRQGRFRSDLYYRLQVLQVTVPPLRERQADIYALVSHFIERYSEQFGKTITGLTEAAWQKVTQYQWPGNVRELQNAIVRATLTAEDECIDTVDLQFGEELPSPAQSVFSNEQQASDHYSQAASSQPLRASAHNESPTKRPTENPAIAASLEPADDWATLQSLLSGQVAALLNESRLEAPVGRWLADTVVLTAAQVSGGVARQAARLLGVPETTLRRQLNKARQNEENPFQLMSRQWLTSLPALTELLQRLMRGDDNDTEFSERCQALLLQEVANHIGDDRKTGATLMGITPPTYARWIQKFEITPQPLNQPAVTTSFMLEQKYS